MSKIWVVCTLSLAAICAAAGMARAAATLSSPFIGQDTVVTGEEGESLQDVALRSNVGWVELVAANPDLLPWLPVSGKPVVIPARHIVPDGPRDGIVVNRGDLRLYWYPTPGAEPQSYPIGIGREGLHTPIGSTKIVRKQKDPTWYPTAATLKDKPWLPKVVPPGPENPMGKYAMYLGWPTYAMHDTNDPRSIGRQASRGCIRVNPEGIATLFEHVPVGTKVTVVDEPVKLARDEGAVWLEVHPTPKQVDELEVTGRAPYAAPDGLTQRVLKDVGGAAGQVDWAQVRRAAIQRNGIPVRVAAAG